MSGTFASDYTWQLQFQPAIRDILTETFSVPSVDVTFTSPDSFDDRRFNTDAFVMIDGRPKRVSFRIRRYVVGDEFTLRYARPESRTEWQKLWMGFGDFLFYGRGTSHRTVEDWFVGAMDVFRRWADSYLSRGEDPPHTLKSNKDGSSEFVAFSRSDMPDEFTLSEDSAAGLRDVAWTIVKDTRGMSDTGHGASVRWARGVLGLDE